MMFSRNRPTPERGSASYEAIALLPFLLFIMAAVMILAFDGLVIAGTEHGLSLGAAVHRRELGGSPWNHRPAVSAARRELQAKGLVRLNGASITQFHGKADEIGVGRAGAFMDGVVSKLQTFLQAIGTPTRYHYRVEATREAPVLRRVFWQRVREQEHYAAGSTWVFDEWRLLGGVVDHPAEGGADISPPGGLVGDLLLGVLDNFLYFTGMIGDRDCWR